MKYLIAVILTLTCVFANADTLYTGAWSKHIDDDPLVNNNTHALIAYEHRNIVVGYYDNSYSEDTVFTLYQYNVATYGNIDLNVGVGISYGYSKCAYSKSDNNPREVCLIAVPEIVYTKYKVQPAILLLGNAVAISIKWEL